MSPLATHPGNIARTPERESAVRAIPFGKPMISDQEKRAALSVLEGTILTHGPLVKAFERDFAAFTGADFSVATSSCAAALHLAALALGIGPGDEVLIAAQTHVSTAHALELCGARCVFVDCSPETGNIDPGAIEAAISPRTKAVALVHFAGIPASMDRIAALARRHGLAVIEDCALALGASIGGTHVGLFGDVGCFSFYPIKHITTIEGGMLISRRQDIAEQASRRRAFGIERSAPDNGTPRGMYDVPLLGNNYRMSEMGAALGIAQLKHLPGFLSTRRRNYDALASGLSAIDGVRVLGGCAPAAESANYCLVLMLERSIQSRRSALIEALGDRGVGTSIYYPRPVPCLSYYSSKYATREADFPHAARISNGSIALPVGPHVTLDDVDYMVAATKFAIQEVM